MNNKNVKQTDDHQEVVTESQQTEQTVAIESGNQKTKSRWSHFGRFISRCIMLLAIICLCLISGFNFKAIQRIDLDLSGVEERINTTTTMSTERLNNVDDSIQQLTKQHYQQTDVINSLYRQNTVQDWILTEIEQLLIMATHRLILAKDVASAIVIMETAELRMQAIKDPALLPIREQLIMDINQLRSVEAADNAGLALYFAGIINITDTLPLQLLDFTDTEAIAPTTADNELKPLWKRLPSLLWQEIKSMLVIQRSNELQQVLLLPKERYFLHQNLRLELANARQSVLNADAKNMRASIDLIKTWLTQYFNTDDASIINLIETMDKIYKIELQPELPDISSSLESIRAHIHNIQRQSIDGDLQQ